MADYALDTAAIFTGIGPNSLVVPVDWLPVTAGGTNQTSTRGFYRALRANAAGTIIVTTPIGSRTMNFLAGETRYGIFLTVSGGTATGIEGGI